MFRIDRQVRQRGGVDLLAAQGSHFHQQQQGACNAARFLSNGVAFVGVVGSNDFEAARSRLLGHS
jgi:hypothetical protein